MEIVSIGSFYLGYESDKYCDFSVHLGNFLIEYTCPNAKDNGSIPPDDGSPDGEAPQSDGTFPIIRSGNTSTSN